MKVISGRVLLQAPQRSTSGRWADQHAGVRLPAILSVPIVSSLYSIRVFSSVEKGFTAFARLRFLQVNPLSNDSPQFVSNHVTYVDLLVATYCYEGVAGRTNLKCLQKQWGVMELTWRVKHEGWRPGWQDHSQGWMGERPAKTAPWPSISAVFSRQFIFYSDVYRH